MEPQGTQSAKTRPSRARTQTLQGHPCFRCTANPHWSSRHTPPWKKHSQELKNQDPFVRRPDPEPRNSDLWLLLSLNDIDHVHFTGPWCLSSASPAGLTTAWACFFLWPESKSLGSHFPGPFPWHPKQSWKLHRLGWGHMASICDYLGNAHLLHC